ncbi:unnamed protein product [Closterium sp. Naga37s-1]|nr:unnamed protein product [Closterium sp. Naga37s-1]
MPHLVEAVGRASPNLPIDAPAVVGTAGETATAPPSPPHFADLYTSPQAFSESPSMSDFSQDSPAPNLPRGPHKSDFPQTPPAMCSDPARLSRGGLRRHRRVASSPQSGPSELEGSLDGNAEREGTQRIVTPKIDGRNAVRSRHNRRSTVGGEAGSGSTETGSSGGNGGHCGDLYGRQELVRLVPAGQITAVSGFSPKSPSVVSLSRKSPLPKSPSSQPLPRPGASPPRRTSYSSDAIPLQRGGCSAEMPLQPPEGGLLRGVPRGSSYGASCGSSPGANSPGINIQRSPFSAAGFRSPRDDDATACAAELSSTPCEGVARAPPRSPAVGRLAAARAWNKMMAMPPLSTELSAPPAELPSPSPRGVSTTVRWELLNAAGGLSGSSAEADLAALSPNPGAEAPRAALRAAPARATPARAIPVSRLRRGRVSSCSSLPVSADLTSALPSSPLSTSPLSPSPLSPLSAASARVLPAASAKPAPAESPSWRDRSGAQGKERAQDSLAVAAQRQQQQQQKQKQQQQQRQLVGASKRDRVKQLRVLGKHGSFEQLSGFFSNVLSLSRGSSGDGSTNSGCSSPCPSNPGSLLEKISAGGKSAKPTDFVLRMPYEDIKARYSLGKKEIGEGRFGSIRTCLERSSGNFYACKTISKKIIETHEEAEDVRREVLFLATLKGHPYIVTLKEALEDKTAIHLIMELCPGGDLFERIKSRAQLTEPEAASILRQLLEALIHSHSLGILHRDVKPENILLCSPSSCSSIKLIDFGVATVLPEGALCNEAAGTPEYMAPEVYDEKYGFGADVWGAGVSLYVMLSGIPPFWESTNQSLEQAIRSKKVSFKHWKWADVSGEAKELITRMLEKDPSKRITAQEALAAAGVLPSAADGVFFLFSFCGWLAAHLDPQ